MEKQRKFINFEASEEIRDMLRYLAKLTKRSQSNYMRWRIEMDYEAATAPPDNGKDQGEEA